MNKEDIINVYSSYDPTNHEREKGIETIINALNDLKREPKLFEFVINILKEQVNYSFNDFFVIEYGEGYERTYNWIFDNSKNAEMCISNLFNSDTNEQISNNMLFEIYRIRKI